MSYFKHKENLYRSVSSVRTKVLKQQNQLDGIDLLELCKKSESIDVEYLPFKTHALRGMAIPAEEKGQHDIILLNNQISERENNFYCAHELIHLFLHREKGGYSFQCYDKVHPNQDRFLEWQANEGGAELIIPYADLFQIVKERMPSLKTWADFRRLKIELMNRYYASEIVINIKLQTLKYELYQYLNGIPLDQIEFMSASEQQRSGIIVPSINDIEKKLRIKESEEWKRKKGADYSCCLDV